MPYIRVYLKFIILMQIIPYFSGTLLIFYLIIKLNHKLNEVIIEYSLLLRDEWYAVILLAGSRPFGQVICYLG